MKKLLLFAVIAAVFGGASVVSTSCGGRASGNTDTLRINTTEMTRDIIGFNGPTPVEITVVKGVITAIQPLPNQEGPGYMRLIRESGFFDKLNGKTLEEASAVQLDAVTGATFSSKALIQNIQAGLEAGKK